MASGYEAQYLKKHREKSTLADNVIKLWYVLAEDPVKVTIGDGLR